MTVKFISILDFKKSDHETCILVAQTTSHSDLTDEFPSSLQSKMFGNNLLQCLIHHIMSVQIGNTLSEIRK